MSVDTKHPLYSERAPDWQKMRDCHQGERVVKDRGFTYLPATSGMLQDGAAAMAGDGWETYKAYRSRARYPEWVEEAVKAMLGVMHHKPPVIELPTVMEAMRESATARGESLAVLLQRINEEQIVLGRVGLLADVSTVGARSGQPYLALYCAEDGVNWDEGQRGGELGVQNLNLVVLNESSFERTGFEWTWVRKHRILVLGDPERLEPEGEGVYGVVVLRESDAVSFEGLIVPDISGRTLVGEIPFIFINAVDVVPEPSKPPLLGLADLCLGMYRGEADYRQSLFMQGQDTLVVVGRAKDDSDVRVGANARIDVPIGGDAKFIGVDSSGLSEQRLALGADRGQAQQMSGQLLDATSRQKESGDALTIRVAARTATLNRVAIAGAFGLQSVLRKVARWIGANPDQVIVEPNLDFIDDPMAGDELAQWVGAKVMGAPLSNQTIHRIMENRDVTDLTYDEELVQIEEEQDTVLGQQAADAGSSSEDGPEDDPEDDPEAEDDGDGPPDDQ